MKLLHETPSQTAGPYMHIGLLPNFIDLDVYQHNFGSNLLEEKSSNHAIKIQGYIFDGAGNLVKDGFLEIWQLNAEGQFASRSGKGNCRGWGRASTDFNTGQYSFITEKPAAAAQLIQPEAPHISFWIAARGINIGLNTRMYFPEYEDLNNKDHVLAQVPTGRLATLLANRIEDNTYQFDIHLQGPTETVFFDI